MAGQTVIVSVLSDSKKFAQGMDEVAGKAGAVFGKVAKVAGAGLLVAGAAVVGLTVKVVQATGEWEQAVGGIESVYGKLAPTVKAVADEAWKMGMSATEYMAKGAKLGALYQGSGMSAAKAWERSEAVMTRAADAATIMGVSTEDANRAVEGMAKGNYTMMDNLGVKMDDATLKAYALEKGMDYTTALDKNDVATAYFMEQTSQYAGNAAKEASKTIQGSLGMLSATWTNLLAGMGNSEADLTQLVANVGESLKAVISNITPVVQSVISALPTILATLIPIVLALVPDLLSAGIELINSLIEGVVTALPGLVAQAAPLLLSFVQGILGMLPTILQAGIDVLVALASGIIQAIPGLIPVAVDTLLALVDTLLNNLPLLITTAITLVVTLALGLIKALPKLAAKVPQIVIKIVTTLIDNIDRIIDAGVRLLIALVENLPAIITGIVGAIPKIITAIVGALGKAIPKIVAVGQRLLEGLWNGIGDKIGWLKNKIGSLVGDVVGWFRNFFDINSPSRVMRDLGRFLPQGLAVGIADDADLAVRAMRRLSNSVGAAFGPELDALDLATVQAGGTVNHYQFGDIHFEPANAQEQAVLDEFVKMLDRRTRTGV